jgi:hypothetical protein
MGQMKDEDCYTWVSELTLKLFLQFVNQLVG